MSKRKNVSLLEFAKSAKVKVPQQGRPYNTDEVYYSKIRDLNSISNEILEKSVIDEIVSSKDHYDVAAFQLLEQFFKIGYKLEKVGYFYDNIVAFKKYGYGKGAQLIYTYCRNVLKGRLNEKAEKDYLSGLWGSYRGDSAAYKYAKYVVRGRLSPELENGCNNLNYIYFLISKGHEIDSVLMGNINLSYNFYKLNWYLPENVHNFMIASHLSGDRTANIYFKQRKKDDMMIRNRLMSMDQTKTVKEIVENLK